MPFQTSLAAQTAPGAVGPQWDLAALAAVGKDRRARQTSSRGLGGDEHSTLAIDAVCLDA